MVFINKNNVISKEEEKEVFISGFELCMVKENKVKMN